MDARFLHTPYDGSHEPFSIGLAPLDPADWIEPDRHLDAHLAYKDRLFSERRDVVLRVGDGTEAAQREVLDALAAYLPDRFPESYRRVDGGMEAGGRRVDLSEDPPLLAAARLVQEDLCLMRRAGEGWRLAAAALCFPSSWSLAEKFGRSMEAIHRQVPGFPGRMGAMVDRIFDNLKVDRPVWRLNWSLYADDDLHHPESKQRPRDWFSGEALSAFVRVERQTLRRMPESGDILFTIKVHVDPVAAFRGHPEGRVLAASLRDEVLGLNEAQLAYKALSRDRDRIAGLLDEIAAGR